VKKIEGVEVKNALRPMRVDVSQKDIENGEPMQPDACALAKCIVRTTKASKAIVHRHVIYVKIGKEWFRFKTSESARIETIVYDRGGRFMPGEYDFGVMPIAQTIARSKMRTSASRGRSPAKAKLAARRQFIQGVRRTAHNKHED